MREARHEDIDYFIRAGREFTKSTPFSFDADGYSRFVHELLKNEDAIVLVSGEPIQGHCAALLVDSFYDPNELVCKVFSTWGKGGLQCFYEVQAIAEERGADFLLADSFIEPRIMRFYDKIGMRQADSVFIKELKNGH